jgi:hypothetical protein
MDEEPLAAIRAATLRIDELHARRVAELEKAIASLKGSLRDLAASALHLLEMSPPNDPADAVIVGDIVNRARKVLAHLERAGQ